MKPKFLYVITAFIIIVTSFFVQGSLDISIVETYYVVPTMFLLLAMALVYFLFAATEWLFEKINRTLNKVLSTIHYFVTTLCLVTSISMMYLDNLRIEELQKLRIVEESNRLESQEGIVIWGLIVLVLFFGSQFVFLYNVLRSLIVKM